LLSEFNSDKKKKVVIEMKVGKKNNIKTFGHNLYLQTSKLLLDCVHNLQTLNLNIQIVQNDYRDLDGFAKLNYLLFQMIKTYYVQSPLL